MLGLRCYTGFSLVVASRGYSSLGAWTRGHMDFSSCSSWVPEHRFSSFSAWALFLCSMWDLPGPGIEPMSPALAGSFLSTVPAGKSLDWLQFSSVSQSCLTLLQVYLSITNSRSLLKLMSIESVLLSNHLILCHPLLLLPSIFPSIRVFSNESVLHIRWSKYWLTYLITSCSNFCQWAS